MADPMTIVITGANRGIGLALAHHFATKPPKTPLTIYACVRKPSSLPSVHTTEGVSVQPIALDVSNTSSIKDVRDKLRANHGNGIDAVINNSGVNYTGSHSVEKAIHAVAVNVDGMFEMTKAFGPLMRRPGLAELHGFSRIINLSSSACSMKPGPFGSYSPKLKQAFANAKTLDDFLRLRDPYLKAVETDQDNEKDGGWPQHNSYKVTKSLVNVLTRVTANDDHLGKDILIECCCPGWVHTDMGSMMGSAPKTPEQGAMVPAALVTGDLKGVTGEYWTLLRVSETSLQGLGVSRWLD